MREGPTRRPAAHKWPLDGILKGVGTLRVLRELYRPHLRHWTHPARPWDIALWSGVTPQGTARILERLMKDGVVELWTHPAPGYAPTYRPVRDHPIREPLNELFAAERLLVPRPAPRLQRPPPDP